MQNPTKLKKKKKGVDTYIAGDSSEASDGVKFIKIGHDIGSKVKSSNSTYCKDYLSADVFNQKYKNNFSRAKYRAKVT